MTMPTQTDTSEERGLLDNLTFDSSVRINSINDEDLRSDIIATVSEIPFVYNMLKKDRLHASDLHRDSQGRIKVNLESPHLLEV